MNSQETIFFIFFFVKQEPLEEEDEEEPLPAGWAMGIAPNGRPFFIDHNDHKTTWVGT